jgi:hypothetical protein
MNTLKVQASMFLASSITEIVSLLLDFIPKIVPKASGMEKEYKAGFARRSTLESVIC